MKYLHRFRRPGIITIFAHVICLIFIMLATGCDDGVHGGLPSDSTKTGSASFSIQWRNAAVLSNPENTVGVQAIDDCEGEGIATVSCDVYDDSNIYLISGGPWPCSEHRGRINAIPAGQNRRIVIFGADADGNIVYQGLSSDDITITPGAVTDVGTIDAHIFVPTLSAPADGASVIGDAFSFNWTPVENAHEYRIQISDSNSFDTPIIDETTVENTYTPPNFSTSSTYYWRIYALDEYANQSAGSIIWSFTTNSAPTAMNDTFTGIQMSSVDNELNVLENDSDPDPDDTLTIVDAESSSAQGGTISINSSADRLIYTPATGYFGDDTFRYTIADEQGNMATAGVTVTVGAGFVPTLSAPVDGANVTLGTFSLNWDPVENAHEYRVLVSDTDSFDTSIIDETTTETTYTPLELSTSTTYYWRIYALDAYSNQGAGSTIWRFATYSAPTAMNDTFTDVHVFSTDNELDVLENDSDPDPGDMLTITDSESPSVAGGTVTINASADRLIYTPAPGYSGEDTFRYTIADRQGNTAMAGVTVIVVGDIERVSVDDQGQQVIGNSWSASISENGRFVAFHSYSEDLVADDNNGMRDVFIFDRGTGIIERVSVSASGEEANGHSYYPTISADGRFVAFYSNANNLVPNDTNDRYDAFVRDRQGTGSTERVSVSTDGNESNDHSFRPAISANGRFVVFCSCSSNLVPGDINSADDIFIRDRQGAGITERVSVSSNGDEANGFSGWPAISTDGRFVAFYSNANNLVPNDSNGTYDIFVRDRQGSGITERVSVSSNGEEANDYSGFHSAISDDGRFVIFRSNASNLVPGDNNGTYDTFVRDRQGSGVTERVSVSSNGEEANSSSGWPTISADGRFVVFCSNASNLVPNDSNGTYDIFIRDRQGTGITERVNVAPNNDEANGHSYRSVISADGRFVAFDSWATNFVPDDTNEARDIFAAPNPLLP